MARHYPRFEVVIAGFPNMLRYHARFIAGNGRIVWVTETYSRKIDARNAIRSITGALPYDVQGHWFITSNSRTVEIREVDAGA